jgi:hypothetical protein
MPALPINGRCRACGQGISVVWIEGTTKRVPFDPFSKHGGRWEVRTWGISLIVRPVIGVDRGENYGPHLCNGKDVA